MHENQRVKQRFPDNCPHFLMLGNIFCHWRADSIISAYNPVARFALQQYFIPECPKSIKFGSDFAAVGGGYEAIQGYDLGFLLCAAGLTHCAG